MLLVVTAPQCYTGSGGALGLKEDVGVKIDDLGPNGAGHMEVAGSGTWLARPTSALCVPPLHAFQKTTHFVA